MTKRFSTFAHRFIGPSGTRQLMDDLGEVLAGDGDYCNLGGGNPAQIPQMQALFRERVAASLADGSFDSITGAYDSPQGNREFLSAIRDLLRREYGWSVGLENLAMTAGSQSSFFILFNLLSGRCEDGVHRHIKLPLTPEYIGYGDIALDTESLVSQRPNIEFLDDNQFKYSVDFEHFSISPQTGAVCVSRPTNPTGNVLKDDEIERLVELTRDAQVPLIIDNAYGAPFPGIIFEPINPIYDQHVIYCLSLSKLGLPGLRTGIVVADAEIIDAIRSMNAILSLATGSLGAVLCAPLIANGELLKRANSVIRPFYAERASSAVRWCKQHLAGLNYHMHKPEGAIFLWLWFPQLPLPAATLYERLKARGVLIIPGHNFFPGLAEPWQHRHECIRISYAQSPREVETGIRIIGEEVRRIFSEA